MQQTAGCITGRRLFAFIFTAVNTSGSDLAPLVWEGGDVSWSINKKVWWRSRLLNVAEIDTLLETHESRRNSVKDAQQLRRL